MSGRAHESGAASSHTAASNAKLRDDGTVESQPPPSTRKPSSSQPLRHGRKPIYPDSDAEAEGLDADVDDEELETGLVASNGGDERNSLLSASGRHAKNATTSSWTIIDHIRARLPLSLGGDPSKASKLARPRAQRRGTSTTSGASRRNSRHLSTDSSFATWRLQHPIIMRTIYVLLGLILLVILLIGIAAAHLFGSTLSSPSPEAQSKILDESLLLKGPDRLQLLNISDDGILVRVDARLGLDPDHALDTWLGAKGRQGWWKNQERKMVEWAMGKVAGVQVDVGEVRLAETNAAWDAGEGLESYLNELLEVPRDMLSFHLDPLVLRLPPLNRHVPDDATDSSKPPILGNHSTPAARHNMHPLNLTVLLKPVSPPEHIMGYVQAAVESGKAKLDVKISSLRVRGLSEKEMHGISARRRKSSWFDVPRRIDISKHLIRSPVQEKVPKMKNDTNADDLLKLDGYEFFEIGLDDDKEVAERGLSDLAMRALGIRAKAVAKNPLGHMLQGQVRYSLPFGIYLPVGSNSSASVEDGPKNDNSTTDDSVLMAVVATEPFALTGQKKIKLYLEGRVVPPPKDSKPRLQPEESWRSLRASDSQLIFSAGPGAIQASAPNSERLAFAPAAGGEDTAQQKALSNFLSRFLRGDANTVYVRGGSPFKPPADGQGLATVADDQTELPGGGSILPGWMDSALRLIDLPISFPGSKVTELIKNVTIADLKITPHPFEKDKLLCSGTVMGIMNLPGQLSTVDVKITHLWPDILVFDGKPPSMRRPGHGGDDGDDDGDDDDEEKSRNWTARTAASLSPESLSSLRDFMPLFHARTTFSSITNKDGQEPEPAPPLPDPLPAKAFGRVRPHDFAPATTFPDPSDPTGQTKLLRSELKDVPFTVLPGRGPIFRSFTWKLVTGEGALAGIEGSSRAKIWNSGLGTLQLRNLPVKGAFVVGKRG